MALPGASRCRHARSRPARDRPGGSGPGPRRQSWAAYAEAHPRGEAHRAAVRGGEPHHRVVGGGATAGLLFDVHHGALNLDTVLEQCPGAQLEGQGDPRSVTPATARIRPRVVGASESKAPANRMAPTHTATATPTPARPRNVTATGCHPYRRRWWCWSA